MESEQTSLRIRGARQKRDWLQTLRQSLPAAWRIARSMRPTYELGAIAELDEGFVRQHGIRGILWDVDGTLTHYHDREAAPEVKAAVSRLFTLPGLRHAIVSNCDEGRYEELARMFPAIPILKLYRSGGGHVGRRREGSDDRWIACGEEPRAEALAHELVPVRKPSAPYIDFAVRELDLSAGEVVMVGDQYWTDVAGANLAGIRSIRIPTVGRSTFPLSLRVFQRLDEWVRRFLA